MVELLTKLAPNVMDKQPEFIRCIFQTLIMLGVSGAISFFIGLFLGVTVTVTKRKGIMENILVWTVLDKLINFFRSIPFIILLALLVPLTRFISGTAIGTNGTFVPLIFGTVPFFTRQVESALAEIDKGLIEAAQAMGTSPVGIIFRVYLKESIPGIVRGSTITFVSLIGLTAMAGAVGGGGIGNFAIKYGYQRNMFDATVVSVLVLLIMVTVIQWLGDFIIKKTTH